jgi:quercetin dioxygenase-like cupin family protein
MPVLRTPKTFTHELPHARFCSLATPSRGASETCVWRVQLSASNEPPPHSLTREEVFVVLSGTVRVSLNAVTEHAEAGDAIVVPAGTELSLSSVSESAELLCCLPVGGQARFADGEAFTPPWAQ